MKVEDLLVLREAIKSAEFNNAVTKEEDLIYKILIDIMNERVKICS